MKELFIPYTEALALKELGFNEKCLSAYTNRGKFHQTSSDYWDNDSIKMIKEYTTIKLKVLAPLYTQAFKFFRDNFGLYQHIQRISENWYTPVLSASGKFRLGHIGQEFSNRYKFNTHEEAELECIRKLIEIVKEQKK